MQFNETPLAGAFTIDLSKIGDDRGFFARMFCSKVFAERGLEPQFAQINNSWSLSRGTVRGLHYQVQPDAEVKLMRCVHGAVFDVIVDLRKGSATHGKWFGAELSAANRRMMYVPKGFAHGFMTLTDNAEVIYPASSAYAPLSERGLRWNDPGIGIDWPLEASEVSGKDASWADFDPQSHAVAVA